MTNTTTDASVSPAESVFTQDYTLDAGNEPIEEGMSHAKDSCTTPPRGRDMTLTDPVELSREMLEALRKTPASIIDDAVTTSISPSATPIQGPLLDISPLELSSGVRECLAKQRPTESTWKCTWQLSKEDSDKEAAGNETPQYPVTAGTTQEEELPSTGDSTRRKTYSFHLRSASESDGSDNGFDEDPEFII